MPVEGVWMAPAWCNGACPQPRFWEGAGPAPGEAVLHGPRGGGGGQLAAQCAGIGLAGFLLLALLVHFTKPSALLSTARCTHTG
jgi:hypothetical protein